MSVALLAGRVPRTSSRTPLYRCRRASAEMAAASSGPSSWLNLEGKVAVVTGGVSGLGKACSLELARNGVKVAITDVRSEEQGKAAAQEVCEQTGSKCVYFHSDVTKAYDMQRVMELASTALGNIDILLNNAGINKPALLVDLDGKHEIDAKVLDEVLSVNVIGVFNAAQAAARQMLLTNTAGVIINVASEAGMQGSLGQSAYAASKGAVYAMTHSWAKEFGGANIRVLGVSPGVLEATGLRTPDYEEALAYTRRESVEALRQTYAKGILLGREARLGEVANVVAFLASERSSYMTGTIINVSGGKSWI